MKSNLSNLGDFSLISNLSNTKLVERSDWTIIIEIPVLIIEMPLLIIEMLIYFEVLIIEG